MKRNLFVWQLGGVTFTAILGTVLHFLYEWTGGVVIASVSAVNESTWEHMKLLFIPSIIFAVIQSFFTKDDFHNFCTVKLTGIILGMMSIPVLFYTLGGAFGELSAIVNIAIFFISIFVEYIIEYFLYEKIPSNPMLKWLSVLILVVILAFFITFTFYPPHIPLFLDPVTKNYGITK